MWLILSKNKIEIIGIDNCLVTWRKTSNSLSSSVFQKLRDGYKVYNHYMNYNKFVSIYYFFCFCELSFKKINYESLYLFINFNFEHIIYQ